MSIDPQDQAKEDEELLRGAPTGVVNASAYRDYLALQAHPLISTNARIIETSQEGLLVDLLAPAGKVRGMIAHLPREEREAILRSATVVWSVRGKMSAAKKRAFGTMTGGKYAFSVSILDPRKAELLELFGRFFTVSQVHQVVTKEWGYHLSVNTIENFRVKWLDEIQRLQHEYLSNEAGGTRLYHRRSRLEEYQWLYDSMKTKYIDTESIERYKQLLGTLRLIKDEVDGSLKLKLEAAKDGQGIDVSLIIDLQIQKDMLSRLSINDIVIGKIAARTGINPAYMISRLEGSFYAKFNGIKFDQDSDLNQKPVWPSTLIYDMDAIKGREQLRLADEAERKALPPITAPERIAALSLQERLRESLRRHQAAANESVAKIDDAEASK